jgi:hypothetical protein
MPRVNRDLQRRMAARRERERRRPAERRYRFVGPEAPESEVEADEALLEQDGQAESIAASTPTGRSARESAPATTPASAARGATRTAPKPFSAYMDEYGYVYGDLRRVGLVIGSLLLILVVLYFVLPLLIH